MLKVEHMPNRTILNKYGLFVSQVRKLLRKREITTDDAEVINRARLIAALSSNHSWRVYRYLHHGDPFDRDAIVSEIRCAFNEGWKEIGENDVKEVITSDIDRRKFSSILLYSLDKERIRVYGDLLPRLKAEFIDGMEPIENREF
jgi:hypothetical protein